MLLARLSNTALALAWAAAPCLGMTGMGFNDLSGWPGDAITHVRIWDR